MSRHDWGFDAGPVPLQQLAEAAETAAARVGHGSNAAGPRMAAAAVALAQQLAEALGGQHQLYVAHFEGHINEPHPGNGDQVDELLIAVRCADPIATAPEASQGPAATSEASSVDETQLSQPATVAAEPPPVAAGDRDATSGEAPVGA